MRPQGTWLYRGLRSIWCDDTMEAERCRQCRVEMGQPPFHVSGSCFDCYLYSLFAPEDLRHVVNSSQKFNIEWESVSVPVYWGMASCSLLIVQTSLYGQKRSLRMQYMSRPPICSSGLLSGAVFCDECFPLLS